ncbi:hypothetical protein DHEL01_v208692 [Diaporthe helianthi]|uniref:Uncharacterized protein n=1 Tax=Diaporthe helianthi TaxID=158607 RepID=A0A2P5HRT7_DIAHE|nr:hypothetical protein DHEL01_v208692 [Diaporthe helianthi]
MVPSRADPSEGLSIPSRSTPVPGRRSFPFSTSILIVTALLASRVGLCAADSSNDNDDVDDELGSVTWTFPRGGEIFHHLDTVNVTYQSSYSAPWLYIWCYENKTANTARFIRKTEVEPLNASALMHMDFSTSTPCWFNLRDGTKSNKGLNSENWSLKQTERRSGAIITGASVSPTTAATSLPSSSASAAAIAVTTAAAAAQASSSSSSGSSNGDDISAGAKAGLGIGVGIGTSLVCAGAFWLYYRHVKRKEHHQEVYRRIMGGGGGSAGPGHDTFAATPNNNNSNGEHLEPWRYGGTPQPAPSAAGSAWSGVSDPSTTDWYAGQQATAAQAPYQYYDPVGSSHQLAAMAGGAGMGAGYYYHHHHHHYPQPSVTTTASMTAEPPRPPPQSANANAAPTSNAPHHHHHPHPHYQTDYVPEAAAIRDVQDLSSSLYPTEYNEPISPISATAPPLPPPPAADEERPSSIPPPRLASVNYGPNGPRDASTGADFTLLPDYSTAPAADATVEEDDIYGPPTPPQHAGAVELPTAQTHRGYYGPQAELPAGGGGVQQQRQDQLRGPEQKVLLRDAEGLRTAGRRRQRGDGG